MYHLSRLTSEGRPSPPSLTVHPSLVFYGYSTQSNKVFLFGADGDRVAVLSRGTDPTTMVWHPTERLLAVGWRDGLLTVWGSLGGEREEENSEREVKESTELHERLAVTAVSWTIGGGLLVSASKSCAIVVWQLDGSSMVLSRLWMSRNEVPVTCAVHLGNGPTTTPFKTRHTGRESIFNNDTASSVVLASEVLAAPGADNDELMFALLGLGSCSVYLLDDAQNVTVIVPPDKDQAPIHSLLWSPQRRKLISLTQKCTVSVHVLQDPSGKIPTAIRRRISTGQEADRAYMAMVWALKDQLVAICTGESMIRIFNLETEGMYVVRMPDQHFSILSMSHMRSYIAATREGRLYMFKFRGSVSAAGQSNDAEDWYGSVAQELGGEPSSVAITSAGDIVVVMSEHVQLMQGTLRRRKWGGNASVVQALSDAVVVEHVGGLHVTIKSKAERVRELDVSFPYVGLWTGSKYEVYSILEATGASNQLHSLNVGNRIVALHPDGLFRYREGKLSFETLQLQSIAHLPFTDAEGTPEAIDVTGDFVAIVTSNNLMKVAKVLPRDLKPVGPTRALFQESSKVAKGATQEKGTMGTTPSGTRRVTMLRVNMKGRKVALLTTVGAIPDSCVWVYDLDTDAMASYDFGDDIPEFVAWNNSGSAMMSDLESVMFAVELRGGGQRNARRRSTAVGVAPDVSQNDDLDESTGDETASRGGSSHNFVTMFASTKAGIVLHHSVPATAEQVCLIGLAVPNVIVCTTASTRATGSSTSDYKMHRQRLRDFVGMQTESDAKLREALVQFSFCATVGNMDEAYRAVKTVKDPSVWSNLARLCVTTKRLDVAEVCLANMQNGIAARALREAKDEPEVDTRVGWLALSLGMLSHAESLFRRAKRMDILTEMLLACDKWAVAVRHAEQHDRIRIQSVRYRIAQNHEMMGQVDEAVKMYAETRSSGTDIPRLLLQQNRMEDLERMVEEKEKDPKFRDMIIWWGQYRESLGNTDEALRAYTSANDNFNLVRLLCRRGEPRDVERATEVVNGLGDGGQTGVGAAYFLGRYYESRAPAKAIQFLTLARAYKRAVRVARSNELHNDVLSISMRSNDKALALDSASYFYEVGEFDKAVHLFQKGGDMQQAISACLKGGLFDVLQQISESLDQDSDPETFIQMADHFIRSGHFDKAVQMLVLAKAFGEALQLCADKDVPLTEELAEAMTLPKTENEEDEEYRTGMLKKIAKVAKDQGAWHLACKKYTQAGERVRALKMLLRAGDTDKVIFFANHSRNAEIYVLAANYLQSQQWSTNLNLFKSIVTFYTKAKAFETLAGFYESVAQVQIDEFRDYDKALASMRDATKAMEKGEVPSSRRQGLTQRLQVIDSFVSARRMIRPGEACVEMVQMCTELLSRAKPDHPDHDLIESAIRVGDVYALLIEYYDRMNQPDNAFALIQRMRAQQIELNCFLEQGIVVRTCRALGYDPTPLLGTPAATNAGAVGDTVEEEFVPDD